MRYIVLTVIVSMVLYLSSCASARMSRENALQDWMLNAQRPINVYEHSNLDFVSTTRGHTCYTLIDQGGKVYFAKNVRFKLPSVIE